MAWPGLPLSTATPRESHSGLSPPSMDMKMYEMMEHLRTVQIVQQEQSRRLDDQAYRLSQLERESSVRDSMGQASRLESQRYLWAPGPIGGSLGGTPTLEMGSGMGAGTGTGMGGSMRGGLGGLSGLGFEVFAPIAVNEKKERDLEIAPDELHDFHEHSNINGNDDSGERTIETDIDNLLHSPTLTPKDPSTIEETSLPSPIDPPSRATSQSPAIPLSGQPPPNLNPNGGNYFPYVLAIQCYLGRQPDRPPPIETEVLVAQINTSVHASFIDSALIHHLGIAHKIRNRRPMRYQTRFSNARPRILLPVYFPSDLSSPTNAHSPTTPSRSVVGDSGAGTDNVAKVMIDFVVVSLNDLSSLDHRLYTQIEIGSQALFLHGIDVLFSTRSIRVAGLSIPLPQIAPRDQKRLLSSIALGTHTPSSTAGHSAHAGHSPVNTHQNWDRSLRRGNKDHDPLPAENAWGDDIPSTASSNTTTTTTTAGGGGGTTGLLRDTSTNSSFSSMSTYQPGSTTAVTSPSMTEIDPNTYTCKESHVDWGKEKDSLDDGEGGISPQTTSFGSALQFIPSSVVARPSQGNSGGGMIKGDEARSRSSTLALDLGSSSAKGVGLDRSQSQGSCNSGGVVGGQEDIHSRRSTQDPLPHLPHLSPNTQHHQQNHNTIEPPTPRDSLSQDIDILCPTIPSRNSSLTSFDAVIPPNRSSSLVPTENYPPTLRSLDIDSDLPRLPSTLLDKVVSRKPSSTWPRSLGKKVAPWTSQDATKTSILGNGFDQQEQREHQPQRKMKVLKPVRSGNVHVGSSAGNNGVGSNTNGVGGSGGGSIGGVGGGGSGAGGSGPEILKMDIMKDVTAKGEVKETSPAEEKTSARAHVGGGAFHWMK